MTLPSGGNSVSISASQIRDEFGPTTESGEKVSIGEYRVKQTFGELSNLPLDEGLPTESGNTDTISFQDFKGKKLNIETRGISDHGFIKSIYFRDPNGYVIELTTPNENYENKSISKPREILNEWTNNKYDKNK